MSQQTPSRPLNAMELAFNRAAQRLATSKPKTAPQRSPQQPEKKQ